MSAATNTSYSSTLALRQANERSDSSGAMKHQAELLSRTISSMAP